jgi:putative resolvase
VQGIHPLAAYRWFLEGTLPVPAVRVNQRTMLMSPDVSAGPAAWSYGLYARVSSYGQEADLDRQVARLASWAAGADGLVMRSRPRSGPAGTGPALRSAAC